MKVFNGRKTAARVLEEFTPYQVDKDTDLLVSGIRLWLLDSLNAEASSSDIWLLNFWNDARAFISFKEKIKFCLNSWLKTFFQHLPNTNRWINQWLDLLNELKESWAKIIVQLPIKDQRVVDAVDWIDVSQDIDNLRWDIERYWCTQSAILWLATYIFQSYWISNCVIIWSEWFIWKWVYDGLKKRCANSYSQSIAWIDKITHTPEELNRAVNQAELIISTSSHPIQLPLSIKEHVSVIDCWLIRWKLGIRWSIPMTDLLVQKYGFITPVPWGIWPLEMLYMIWKVKEVSESDIDMLLSENIVFSELEV